MNNLNKPILFSKEYIDNIKSGDKDTTVRVDQEVGLFKEGHVYSIVEREANKPTNIKILITSVQHYDPFKIKDWMKLDKAPDAAELLGRQVDVIKFKVI